MWDRKGPTLATPVLAMLIWPILANPILDLVCVKVGLEGGPRTGEGFKGEGPNPESVCGEGGGVRGSFAFFPSPPPFRSFCVSVGV